MEALQTAYGALDIGGIDPRAQRVVTQGGRALAPAAKGMLPGLQPKDSIVVLVALSANADAAIADTAKKTLGGLPAPLLTNALDSEPQAAVVTAIAEHHGQAPEILSLLLRQPNLDDDALAALARDADEEAGELIATNEARLLLSPAVIERLYLNKKVRMSTANRVLELAVRHNLELSLSAYKEMAEAIQTELIPEATNEAQPSDLIFAETDAVAQETEGDADTHEIDDEGEESLKPKFTSLYQQILMMSITEKIRRAMLGSAAERNLLVRDSNRLVAVAAAKSPLMREPDAALIASSRAVHQDVLREIARNRSLIRSYRIKTALVINPRTPFIFASRLVPHLRDAEVRMLAKSKHVSSNIQRAARQQLSRKKH